MVICPSIPVTQYEGRYYGEEFLLRYYNAWGFVNLAKEPDYFGLYISSPVKAVRYFGVVDEIIDARDGGHPVDDFREYEPYEEGDKLILLEKDSIIELEDEISFSGKPVLGFHYTTLDKFIDAESTDELWEG